MGGWGGGAASRGAGVREKAGRTGDGVDSSQCSAASNQQPADSGKTGEVAGSQQPTASSQQPADRGGGRGGGRTGAGGCYHNGEFSGSGGMPARERWSQTGFCGIVRRKPHNSLRHASRSNTEESVGFNSQYTSANCENSVAVSTLGMSRQARGLGNRYENRLSNMRQ